MNENGINIYIPTIHDDYNSVKLLANFNQDLRKALAEVENYGGARKITFNFSKSQGLGTLGISYMSVISNYVKVRGWELYYHWSDATESVKRDFEISGFNQRYFKDYIDRSPYVNNKSHNNILFQDFYGDSIEDIEENVLLYIENQWFNEANFLFDSTIYSEMLGSFIEMFANAAEHSGNGSTVGIAAYGMIDNEQKDIYLTLIDLGKGIANKVQYYFQKENNVKLSELDAVRWALEPNHTTRSKRLGGQGFTNIKQFLRANRGKLDIVSNSVHVTMDSDLETIFEINDVNFSGTILMFRLNNENVIYFKEIKGDSNS